VSLTPRAARWAALAAAGSLVLVAPSAAHGDDGPVEAGIVVQQLDLPDGFMRGVDVSTVLSEEESGVVFRDTEGHVADLFDVLADAGVTDVRIRVWNDPYDAAGNGYGGGTVSVSRAVQIGQRATAAGLGVLVDFHYSDFWADPSKQDAPKEWEGMTVDEKADALGEYTTESLEAFADADVDVRMVQVGNETNNGVAGVTGWDGMAELFAAGSAAVRDVFPDALIALHFTDPQTVGWYGTVAAALDARDVDYDVFASSYYPYWHGSLANLTSVLSDIADTYGKKVMVAETSWPYTLDDGDGWENNVRAGTLSDPAFAVSEQGQADEISDVMAAVAAVPGDAGIGVFYWEPAWIPVGTPDELTTNRQLWEAYGSGWATSYAGEYHTDAAQWYGGSAWDNQALFDHDGYPLESLQTFRYVLTGATAPLGVTSIEQPTITVTDGDEVVLPATVTVTYNDRSTTSVAVTWSDAAAWINGPGTYTIGGTTSAGATTAVVVVKAVNLLPNPSFEEGWGQGWTVDWTNAPVKEDAGNAHEGSFAVNFWAGSTFSFAVSRQVTGLDPGTYVLSAWGAGGDTGTGVVELVGASGGTERTAALPMTGWQVWSNPSVTVVVGDDGTLDVALRGTDVAGGGWGWLDDLVLTFAGEAVAPDTAALEGLLDRAAAVDRDAYTPDSFAALDSAVEIAQVVLAGSRSGQDEVDAAAALLTTALAGLVANPVPAPGVTVGASSVTAGGAVRVAGTGFAAGEQVQVVLHSDPVLLATWTADGSGAVAGTVVVPASTPAGTHTLVLTGVTSGRTASATVVVLASGELAATGSSSRPLAGLALLMIAAGAAGVVVSVRANRRRA
jgi:arabinogalactan endo-1,4-beta-galactosidase